MIFFCRSLNFFFYFSRLRPPLDFPKTGGTEANVEEQGDPDHRDPDHVNHFLKRLKRYNTCCVSAFGSLFNLKFNGLTFVQCAKAIGFNFLVMDEYVFAFIR